MSLHKLLCALLSDAPRAAPAGDVHAEVNRSVDRELIENRDRSDDAGCLLALRVGEMVAVG
jgi:hypothetical protein